MPEPKKFKPTTVLLTPERLSEIDQHVLCANLRAMAEGARLHIELETRSSFIRAAVDHYIFCGKGLQKIL